MTQQRYCGFVCSSILEQQQQIVDEIRDFSDYNPEFAAEMLQKLKKIIDQTTLNVRTPTLKS